MCLSHCPSLKDNPAHEKPFRELCSLLSGVLHYRFHQVKEALKAAYATLDPDADTRVLPENVESDQDFRSLLENLLEKANYERISEQDLNQAMQESSLFNVRLHVDFQDFSEVLLFCRGESTKQQTVSSWFGLRKTEIEFINYERVVVYIRFKDDRSMMRGKLSESKPGLTLLKLFRNVPKADLEMLFPNTRVRMRTIDKVLIGVPAAISGGIVLTTKLGATLILLGSLLGFWLGLSKDPVELNQGSMTVLFAGIAALGGYLWKQFNSFKNRKMAFTQALTENLYFKNLDNNAGVFHRLIDEAEEEENKEAILAYVFLLTSLQPMAQSELDKRIEQWMQSIWQCTIDFEIDDALQKLMQLQLVQMQEGKYTALDLDSAVSRLRQHWDALA